MNLDVSNWKDFNIDKLFSVEAGKYYYSDEYTDGETPYCSASAENNGISKKIDLDADFHGNQIITGKVGCTSFYEGQPFCATSDVNVLTPRFKMSPNIGLFIVTIINKNENYRWNYGRQCRVSNTKKINIKLPIQKDYLGNPVIDKDKHFSSDGFIPDWQWMEDYIKSLHHKSISTKVTSISDADLKTTEWKEFLLKNLFKCGMGNGIDAVVTTNDNPQYNYVSRDSNGNGVVGFVDAIEGESPFPSGAMSLALGGSFLGSCFIQKKPFYTAQNVAVLQEKIPMSTHVKLFVAALIRNECKIKYQAFGRELNAHFRKDFSIRLPVKRDNNGNIVIDPKQEFSPNGYIPDWDYMDQYMKSLPFSDRI